MHAHYFSIFRAITQGSTRIQGPPRPQSSSPGQLEAPSFPTWALLDIRIGWAFKIGPLRKAHLHKTDYGWTSCWIPTGTGLSQCEVDPTVLQVGQCCFNTIDVVLASLLRTVP